MATNGLIKLTNTDSATDWTLQNEDGDMLQNGSFPEIDLADENFDFDAVTEQVAEASGYAIENDERYTESDTNQIYWTVAFN